MKRTACSVVFGTRIFSGYEYEPRKLVYSNRCGSRFGFATSFQGGHDGQESRQELGKPCARGGPGADGRQGRVYGTPIFILFFYVCVNFVRRCFRNISNSPSLVVSIFFFFLLSHWLTFFFLLYCAGPPFVGDFSVQSVEVNTHGVGVVAWKINRTITLCFVATGKTCVFLFYIRVS